MSKSYPREDKRTVEYLDVNNIRGHAELEMEIKPGVSYGSDVQDGHPVLVSWDYENSMYKEKIVV